MTHHPDIDLDFSDRADVLTLFKHHPASIIKNSLPQKHPSGVYITDIPIDPRTGLSSLDHKIADERGYFKLDFLNVHVYNDIRDEQHLDELKDKEPNWKRLWTDREFCEKVIHISKYYTLLGQMKPDTIPRMAMFLSIKLPSKRHLIGKPWKEIAETVWVKPDPADYYFKHAHAIAYSVLVGVHINLLEELEANE